MNFKNMLVGLLLFGSVTASAEVADSCIEALREKKQELSQEFKKKIALLSALNVLLYPVEYWMERKITDYFDILQEPGQLLQISLGVYLANFSVGLYSEYRAYSEMQGYYDRKIGRLEWANVDNPEAISDDMITSEMRALAGADMAQLMRDAVLDAQLAQQGSKDIPVAA